MPCGVYAMAHKSKLYAPAYIGADEGTRTLAPRLGRPGAEPVCAPARFDTSNLLKSKRALGALLRCRPEKQRWVWVFEPPALHRRLGVKRCLQPGFAFEIRTPGIGASIRGRPCRQGNPELMQCSVHQDADLTTARLTGQQVTRFFGIEEKSAYPWIRPGHNW